MLLHLFIYLFILLIWCGSTFSHRGKKSLQFNTELFWLIVFILWWNMPVLTGMVSSRMNQQVTRSTDWFAKEENDVNLVLYPSQSLDRTPGRHLQILAWCVTQQSKHRMRKFSLWDQCKCLQVCRTYSNEWILTFFTWLSLY